MDMIMGIIVLPTLQDYNILNITLIGHLARNWSRVSLKIPWEIWLSHIT